MNVIDLFGGVGGFSLGAHQAGFAVPLAIDLDEHLTRSRPINFPRGRVLQADIATVTPSTALENVGLTAADIVGIIGGPPCQGFSSIGSRKPDDPRNQLLFQFFRFVRAIEPAFFVLENVPGILLEKSRPLLDEGLSTVAGQYELVGPIILDAANYGAPTHRRRVVVVGYRKDRVSPLSEGEIRAAGVTRETTVFEAIHDLASPTTASERDGNYWATYRRTPVRGIKGLYARNARKMPPAGLASPTIRQALQKAQITGFKPTAHTGAVRRRFDRLAQGGTDAISRYPRLSWDAPCPTLRAGTGPERGSYQAVRPVHPDQSRVITVREAGRLQGFPDWFQFHPTQWHSFRMIGNSVSPMLAAGILRLLKNRVEA